MNAATRLVLAVVRRERWADAAHALSRWALPAGLVIAAISIACVRRFSAPPTLVWLCAVPVPAVLAWAILRPRNLRQVARRIDRHYGLDDQIGSALELARTTSARPTADPRTDTIIALLLERAEGTARTLDPRPVVPLRIPGPRLLDALALVATIAALFVPPPKAPILETQPASPDPAALPPKSPREEGLDLALAEPLRQNLRALTGDDDASARTAERILEILDALERGEIDRALAFERLEQLEGLLEQAEAELEASLEEDPGLLADAIRELAAALEEHEITEAAGQAFAEDRPDEAEQALDEAGLRAEREGSERALDRAMASAERALARAAERESNTDAELDDAERRLRREQAERPGESEAERERRLKDLERRVEQLKRQQEQEQAARKRLEQLRREAEQAGNGQQSAAERKRSLQKLSRDAGGAARQARSARRMQQARDGLDEAKNMVRRAGDRSEGAGRRRQQVRRFSQAAKGKKPGSEKGNDKGKSTLLVEGEIGEGEPDMMFDGEDAGEGQGQPGDSDGSPGEGEGDGQDGDSDGQGQSDGASPGRGEGIGDGSTDPLGAAQESAIPKRDVHVQARAGRGVSRAEVIRQSGQDGFATEAYRDVYTDYRSFAQSALDNEALPPAKRRAVKRYYQLIQPR